MILMGGFLTTVISMFIRPTMDDRPFQDARILFNEPDQLIRGHRLNIDLTFLKNF